MRSVTFGCYYSRAEFNEECKLKVFVINGFNDFKKVQCAKPSHRRDVDEFCGASPGGA